MKASVTQGVSQRPLAAGQELDALNDEVRPVLSAVRDVANQESRFKAVTTTDALGVYKRLWESDQAPTSGTWMVEARVVGADGAGDTAVGYILRALFQISAAAVALVGATDVSFSRESVPAPDARFGIDTAARTIYVEAVDDGVELMRYSVVVIVGEVT